MAWSNARDRVVGNARTGERAQPERLARRQRMVARGADVGTGDLMGPRRRPSSGVL